MSGFSTNMGQTNIKNVTIAVTPEGFWCFRKAISLKIPWIKPNLSLWDVTVQVSDGWGSAPASSSLVISDDQQWQCRIGPQRSLAGTSLVAERVSLAIEFGEPGTCDRERRWFN